jgi:hypothetical protein
MNPIVTEHALERGAHRFDPLWIYAEVGLRRCTGCGRIWRVPHSRDQFEALKFRWLKLMEPTGWTFDDPVDEVYRLEPAEALLWNAEPCPGPPTLEYRGAIDNAVYRLLALGVIDTPSLLAALAGEIPAICDAML